VPTPASTAPNDFKLLRVCVSGPKPNHDVYPQSLKSLKFGGFLCSRLVIQRPNQSRSVGHMPITRFVSRVHGRRIATTTSSSSLFTSICASDNKWPPFFRSSRRPWLSLTSPPPSPSQHPTSMQSVRASRFVVHFSHGVSTDWFRSSPFVHPMSSTPGRRDYSGALKSSSGSSWT